MTFADNQFSPQDRTQYTGGSGPATAEFKPGQIIGDNYQVLAWIGAGGMGNVYRVKHTIMQTQYALKTLSADRVTETAWRRFQNEAQAIAKMSHPNIVAIYNLGLHEDRLPYYVMDLLHGQTLMDLIKTKGPLEIDETLGIFLEVCAGIGYAHTKGIVHRDIKPPNIMILDDAGQGSGRIKIVDFGIVKLTTISDENHQKLTNVGEVCGSPYYMSPEQCDGRKVDARSDIYSLGCTLFETLTGKPPYKGRNAMETMFMHQSARPPTLTEASAGKQFPAELEQAVAKMLAKAPMDRYQNMDLVRTDLKGILKARSKAKVKAAQAPDTGKVSQEAAAQTSRIRRPATSTRQIEKAAADQGPKVNLLPLAVTAATLALVTVGWILWQLQLGDKKTVATTPNQSASNMPAVTPKTTAEPVAPQQNPQQQAVDATPFSSVETDAISKKRQIVFNFPQQVNLGEILLDSPNKADATKTIPCQGRQTIEGHHKLYFFPSEDCVNEPNYFCKFGPDLLYSITMPKGESRLPNRILLALARIARLKSLNRLDLLNCDDASDNIVTVMDQCTELEDLSLSAYSITIRKLVQSKTITRLRALKYSYGAGVFAAIKNGKHFERDGDWGEEEGRHDRRYRHKEERDGDENITQNISTLLDGLQKKAPHLEVLEIPSCSLLPAEIAMIAQLKDLRKVDLSNSNMLGINVDLLSNLSHLEVFHVDGCLIGKEAIAAFKKLRAHSLKTILMDSPVMTPETVEYYRKELPGVTVNP